MVEASEETMHGGPLPHKTEGAKIISKWIEPVRLTFPFGVLSLRIPCDGQIKNLAMEQLATSAMSAASFASKDHPHTSFDPLSHDSLNNLTDMHVAATVKLVSESAVVQEAWAAGMELSVHGWVYHVATAKLRDLDIGIDGPGGHEAKALGSKPSSRASSDRPGSPAFSGEDSDAYESADGRS